MDRRYDEPEDYYDHMPEDYDEPVEEVPEDRND